MIQAQGIIGMKALKPDTGWKQLSMVQGKQPAGQQCYPKSLDSSPKWWGRQKSVGQGPSPQPPIPEALGANSRLPCARSGSCCCFLVPCARPSPCLSQHTCQHQAGAFPFPQVQASSLCTFFQGPSRKEQLGAEHYQLPSLFMIYWGSPGATKLLIWHGERKYRSIKPEEGIEEPQMKEVTLKRWHPVWFQIYPWQSGKNKTRETVKRTVVATGWDRSDERWNIGFLEQEKLFFVILLRVVASHYVLLKPIECTTEWNPNVNCGLGLIIMYQD